MPCLSGKQYSNYEIDMIPDVVTNKDTFEEINFVQVRVLQMANGIQMVTTIKNCKGLH